MLQISLPSLWLFLFRDLGFSFPDPLTDSLTEPWGQVVTGTEQGIPALWDPQGAMGPTRCSREGPSTHLLGAPPALGGAWRQAEEGAGQRCALTTGTASRKEEKRFLPSTWASPSYPVLGRGRKEGLRGEGSWRALWATRLDTESSAAREAP